MNNTSSEIHFRKFLLPEIVFGLDSRFLASEYAKVIVAKKVLIVTDEGIKGAGWVEDIKETLNNAKICFVEYSNVTPNPRTDEIVEGATFFAEEKCDSLLAIGGGSVIDCAKGIGILSRNGGIIQDYEGTNRVVNPIPPLICVATTAGTAAGISQFAVYMELEKRRKFCVISKYLIPRVSLIDPVTTTTMPPRLTAETGLDALSHAIEAYVSTGRSPITDIHAREAVSIICKTLPLAVETGDNLEARSKMMLGSLHAGIAFSNTGLGAIHAISHVLGGFFDIPHGECNAILLEHVVAYNFDAAPHRYEQIGKFMGIDLEGMYFPDKKRTLIEALSKLRSRLGIVQKLRNLGMKKSEIPDLADAALKDPCMITNPKRLMHSDVEAIYERAL